MGYDISKRKTPFLEVEWKPQDDDKAADWELLSRLAPHQFPVKRLTVRPFISDGDSPMS